ncbi:MAG: branched-chain amino acid ABC transporter permease [Actinobacteria bacterium]|jgi:branched-chain amino acid transport system permease protein|nr:branched-chain amino acid ABC transporter permease [Actinomycetota bacterium]MBT5500927.1 branched-chain amino acid ABC transporter permease [Actinomycetota bacterium]MDA9869769.1 branched-chain amino acid ABC transporter permease [bacterium]HBK39712.1 amino acid ABC transporter permease [Actinomycetota bacterium]
MVQDLLNATTLASIYVLFALGMSLVWGTIGILNFAHGSIFMFSAFIAYLVVQQIPLGMPAVIAIAMVSGALIAVAMQYLVFQPIMKKAKNPHAGELQLVIGGIGLSAIPISFAQRSTLSNPFGFSAGTFETQAYTIGGVIITNVMIIILIVGLGLGVGTALWIRNSKKGLALRALGVDPEVSAMMGIDRPKLALATMLYSGALAGLAGALLTYYFNSITSESGDTLLLKAFAIIILGGVGSIFGVILGSFILAFAEFAVLLYTNGSWVTAVSFGLLFLILLIRPQGILGKKEVRRT